MNIFVAKLNPSTEADGLTELFSSFGDVVSSKVIMDRDTGRSKCFGFVEMTDDEAGAKAISALHDSEFEGNILVVKKSEPKPESAGNNYRSDDRGPSNKRYDNRGSDRRNDGGNQNRNERGFDTSKW
ncbi:MAG: RNA recognition motif-containing protein [Bacteroidia bacterium]|jgi:RNA recognition motif-containing protein